MHIAIRLYQYGTGIWYNIGTIFRVRLPVQPLTEWKYMQNDIIRAERHTGYYTPAVNALWRLLLSTQRSASASPAVAL